MNKYELALVVSAKVEDEVRDAVVEKAKSLSLIHILPPSVVRPVGDTGNVLFQLFQDFLCIFQFMGRQKGVI